MFDPIRGPHALRPNLLAVLWLLKYNCLSHYNERVISTNLRPMRLSRPPTPFDSDEYLYELKIDGFRALAHIVDYLKLAPC
jgi:hypothetical protein